MDIEERVKIAILMKYYGSLLTENQVQVIDMYVDNNLTLQEVADELKISRQAVKDTLDKAILSLNDYENKLHFIARDGKLKKFIEDLDPKIIDFATKLKLMSIIEED